MGLLGIVTALNIRLSPSRHGLPVESREAPTSYLAILYRMQKKEKEKEGRILDGDWKSLLTLFVSASLEMAAGKARERLQINSMLALILSETGVGSLAG